MEGSSSESSDQNPTAENISSLLSGLPSRGLFSSALPSTTLGGMRVYVCEHDTTPTVDQQIKTNQENILIRSLKLNKQKASSKAAAANEGSRKRIVEKESDRSSAKRANTASSSGEGGVTSFPADFNFQSLTVERLRALLKERGLPLKGRKDELVARMRAANAND